jgi:hypothetical protein
MDMALEEMPVSGCTCKGVAGMVARGGKGQGVSQRIKRCDWVPIRGMGGSQRDKPNGLRVGGGGPTCLCQRPCQRHTGAELRLQLWHVDHIWCTVASPACCMCMNARGAGAAAAGPGRGVEDGECCCCCRCCCHWASQGDVGGAIRSSPAAPAAVHVAADPQAAVSDVLVQPALPVTARCSSMQGPFADIRTTAIANTQE